MESTDEKKNQRNVDAWLPYRNIENRTINSIWIWIEIEISSSTFYFVLFTNFVVKIVGVA